MTLMSSSFISLPTEFQVRVMIELEDRRHQEITYTKPLHSTSDMKEFLQNFYGEVYTPEKKAFYDQERRKHPIVNVFYRQLCGTLVTMEDFWQRYEYRCHLDRIADDLLRRQASNHPFRSTDKRSTTEKSTAISTPTRMPCKSETMDIEQEARKLWEEEEVRLATKFNDGLDGVPVPSVRRAQLEPLPDDIIKKSEDLIDGLDQSTIEAIYNDSESKVFLSQQRGKQKSHKIKTRRNLTKAQKWKDRLATKRSTRQIGSKEKIIPGEICDQVRTRSLHCSAVTLNEDAESPSNSNVQEPLFLQNKRGQIQRSTTNGNGNVENIAMIFREPTSYQESQSVDLSVLLPLTKSDINQSHEKEPLLHDSTRQALIRSEHLHEISQLQITITNKAEALNTQDMQGMNSNNASKHSTRKISKYLTEYRLENATTNEDGLASFLFMEEKENTIQTTNQQSSLLPENAEIVLAKRTEENIGFLVATTLSDNPSVRTSPKVHQYQERIVNRKSQETMREIGFVSENLLPGAKSERMHVSHDGFVYLKKKGEEVFLDQKSSSPVLEDTLMSFHSRQISNIVLTKPVRISDPSEIDDNDQTKCMFEYGDRTTVNQDSMTISTGINQPADETDDDGDKTDKQKTTKSHSVSPYSDEEICTKEECECSTACMIM